MKIAVNDASILFDLIDAGLIHSLFQLDCTFCTTDYIINEITEAKQRTVIQKFVDDNSLTVLSIADISKIYDEMKIHPALSSQDCSVLITAREKNAVLLTGDNSLRKIAAAEGLEVHGVLWVLDVLLDKGIISSNTAHDKLSDLMKINSFLPLDECNKRLNKWKT